MPDLAVFTANFTGTAGTDLNAYTPDLGDGFVRHNDFATAIVITNANRARNAGGGSDVALYLADYVPDSADYIVKGTIRKLSDVANHYTGLMGRATATGLTGYIINQVTAGTWALAKLITGSYFSLGTYSQSLVDGQDYDIELRMAGDQISVVIDGIERITATDSAITDAGKAAIVTYIGVTNSTGQHLDSFEVAVDVPVETVPVTDSNLYFSANFYDDGTGTPQSSNIRANATYAETVNPGAEARIAFTGTQCTPVLDVSSHASFTPGNEPRVRYRVDSTDDNDWVIVQLDNEPRAISVTGLTAGNHVLELMFESTDWTEERWTSPVSRLRITSFEVDVGEGTIPLTGDHAPKNTNAAFYGDSITEGLAVNAATVAGSSAFQGYSKRLADLLGCNRINVGFGGQGYDYDGTGGVPRFTSGPTWKSHISGKTRMSGLLAVPQAEHVFVAMGTNDSLNSLDPTSSVTAQLTALREAYPLASLWQLIPFGGFAETEITAGFDAYQLATPDDNCFLYTPSAGIRDGIDQPFTPSPESVDGLHPGPQKSIDIADDVFAFVQANAPQSITVTSPTSTDRRLTGVSEAITWDDTGYAANVDILLSLDGGSTYSVTIASSVTNDNSYDWTPTTDHITATAKVKVRSSADALVFDVSDTFVIATTEATGASLFTGVIA